MNERKAYALYKEASQYDSDPMFAERLSRSVECCCTTSEWYRKGSGRGNEAIALRCDAIAIDAFVTSTISSTGWCYR